MNFLKRLFKKESLKDKEVWHYMCKNSHKWKSMESPKGTYVYGIEGQTRCPICQSTIIMGDVYINGEKTIMGAIHQDFKIKKRKKHGTPIGNWEVNIKTGEARPRK